MSFGVGRLGAGMGRMGSLGRRGVAPANVLDLNFKLGTYTYNGATVSLSSVLGVTRSQSESVTDAAGNVSYITGGNPAIGSAGMQVWPASNNFLTQSNFASGWNPNLVTITPNSTMSPDGTSNAAKIVETGVGNWSSNTASVTNGTAYIFSVYAAPFNGNNALTVALSGSLGAGGPTAVINLATGAITSQSGTFNGTVIVEQSVNGFWRISCPVKANTSSIITPVFMTAGGSGTGVYVWGAQFEPGTVSTPLIPTTSAGASRSADIVSFTGTAATLMASAIGTIEVYSNKFKATSGTIVDANGTALLNYNSNTSGNLATAVSAALPVTNTATWSAANQSSIAWNASGRDIVLNAAPVASDSAAMTPAGTFYVGSTSGTSNFISGNIERIVIYSARLSPTALGAFVFPSNLSIIVPGLSQPAAAAAQGYNRIVFHDDFSSIGTIDTSNTRAAGFNWYLRTAWSKSVFTNWRTFSDTNPAFVSVSGGVLTLSNTSQPNITLVSAAESPLGSGFVGTVVGGGMYVEVVASFNPALSVSPSDASWPAWWTMAVEGLLGFNFNVMELDFYEAFPGTGQIFSELSEHQWAGLGTNLVNTNTAPTWTAPTFTSMNNYGYLLVPSTKNAGTGLMSHFINGTSIPSVDVTYSKTAPATPGASPSNPNGLFFLSDTQHFPIILTAGTNVPVMIDRVTVWAS